jgi:hypothetical protein
MNDLSPHQEPLVTIFETADAEYPTRIEVGPGAVDEFRAAYKAHVETATEEKHSSR